MNTRIDAVPMPTAIAQLPVNNVGYPVPWFIGWVDGVPDFRTMDERKLQAAIRDRLCWVCGEPLGLGLPTFVVGPMCGVNRTSAEPPSHAACARYAAQTCPFLTVPHMHRRERGMPDHPDPAGIMIKRNPGVALLWGSRTYSVRVHTGPVGGAGILFDLGEPLRVAWFCEGRPATRVEVLASLDSGMPLLREFAELDGPVAVADLAEQFASAVKLIPA